MLNTAMLNGAGPEAKPQWAVRRDTLLAGNRKNMDSHALVHPFGMTIRDRSFMDGIWIAYNHTLMNPARAYVWEEVVTTASHHAFQKSRLTPNPRAEQVYADLGAGNGRISEKVLDRITPYTRIHGYLVDQSAPALSSAWIHFSHDKGANTLLSSEPATTERPLSPLRGPGGALKLTFLQEDVTGTSIPDGSVDIATMVNVFHHLDYSHSLVALEEVNRMLKEGGRFIFVDTHRLPEPVGIGRVIRAVREWRIRKAVDADVMIKSDAKRGINRSLEVQEGMRKFSNEDAPRAFENAMTLPEFDDLLNRSALANSVEQIRILRSPGRILKYLYPSMIFATGVKVKTT